jgi:uncharacterized protein (TIGR02996 family)
MNHPENPDLLAGIIANAEDDAPRLVYADWLEENGDPDRAEFIRVQCALFDKSPADPDYIDLVERKMAVLPTLWGRRLGPALPKGVDFHDNSHEQRDDSGAAYHRGFPYFAMEPHVEGGLNLQNERQCARQFRDALPEVIETTTLRGLKFYGSFSRQLAEILPSPASAHVSALSAHNEPAAAERRIGAVEAVVSSPAAHSLRWLHLNYLSSTADTDTLAGAKGLDRMRRLEVAYLTCEPAALERLTAAGWFGRLRRVEVRLSEENAAAGVQGFARLPDLHTLELRGLGAGGLAAFSKAGQFRALGKLSLDAQLRGEGAVALGQAVMPKLAVLDLTHSGLRNDDVTALSRSGLFANLCSLSLRTNEIGDKGVAAIAGSPAAGTLRVLSLGDNNFGKRGLAAIAKAGAFPSLTNLDLRSSLKRKASAEDVTQFLAQLNLPRLRYLDLQGWPLGDEGAKTLAANPAFTNLVGLNLGCCRIGPEGAAALFASQHLQRLVKLELSFDPMGRAPEALLNRAVMPSLRECWLSSDVPKDLKKQIETIRGTLVVIG